MPVAQATTPSLEALRAYTLGLEERRRGAELEAIPFLERALELDPGFAAAATTLSTVYGNLGEASRSIDYARLAYGQRNKVSQRERLFITYQYYDRVTGDLKLAADTLDVWKRTFPNDFQPANALAIIHNRLGRYEQGVLEAKDALARTPGHPFAASQLAYAYRGLGRYEEARRVAEEVRGARRGDGADAAARLPARRAARRRRRRRGPARVGQGQPARVRPRGRRGAGGGVRGAARARRRALPQRASPWPSGRSLRETGRTYTAHDAITRALYGQTPRRWR